VYLWHPRTRGALYVYDRFLAPFISAREEKIDDILAEVFARVGAIGGDAFARAWAYARRSATNALAKAQEAQMRAESGANAASGRAESVRRRESHATSVAHDVGARSRR